MFKHTVIGTILITAMSANVAMAEAPSVYVGDLDFSELEIHQPDDRHMRPAREFELNEEELEGLNEMYREAVTRSLSRKDRYQPVETADAAELVISATLLDIRPTAPKDDFRSRDPFADYYTRGAGSAKIRITVDGPDGEVLSFEDRNDAGWDWQENNRINNRRDVKRMFGSWGSTLVKKLDKI